MHNHSYHSFKKLFKVTLTSGLLLGAVSTLAADSEWRLPEELNEKIEKLDETQRRFITEGDFLDFMSPRQMTHELANRDTDGILAMVNDVMSIAESMGYNPQQDMGAIPLNTSTERFNMSMPTPAILRDDTREPGPFSVHRYMFPASGVPTFASARVAIYPEDLTAGDVDVAIVGVPNDMGSGRRNAEYGPRVMRALDTIATPDVNTLVDPMEVLNVVDYGDFSIDNMSTERTVGHVTAMVAETAATGVVPMIVGGDTSMLYPGVRGVAETQGYGEIGLVHFSAHPDADREAVHTISDEQALFLLLDEGIIDGEDMITVGLRGPAVTADILQWLRDQGVRYHTMAEVGRRGFDRVLERVMDEVDDGPDRFFVSVDVSVIEPTQMVAAGRIVANGLDVQRLSATIRHICADKDIVGFEITDMAPMLDYSRLSAVNANTVLNACLVGMAARKAGFDADEFHPLAVDHDQ